MKQKTRIQVKLVLPSVGDEHDACFARLGEMLNAHEGISGAHLVGGEGDDAGEVCIHYDPDVLTIGQVREIAQRAGAQLEKRYGHLLLKFEAVDTHVASALEARAGKIRGVLEVAVSPAGVMRVEYDRDVREAEWIKQDLAKMGVPVEAITGAVEEGHGHKDEHEQGKCDGEHAHGHEGHGHEGHDHHGHKHAHKHEHKHDHKHDHKHEDGHKHGHGHGHNHDHGGFLGGQAELVFALLSGGTLLAGWLSSMPAGVPGWVPLSLYIAACFFGGFFTLREAIESIRAGRFEIDFLMLVAAAGAGALGEWGEGALLLFLFSLGHSLEHYAMGRAKRAIESLSELAPETATVRREGKTQEVPVGELRPGDEVIVKPNERIAADGFVIAGLGSVNQAPITGESVPVEKRAVEDRKAAAAGADRLEAAFRVYAGTINGSTGLEIQVTKLAGESTLARVVQMVSEAETQKSPTQRFADTFQRYFVPSVLALVVLLLFAWVVIDEPFSKSFYRAMAVLVAASPCALAISTPSAVLSGVARAARGGVLFKGGGPLENLGRLQAIAFDKTGTLTEGKPKLTDVVTAEGVSEEELLRAAVAVESLSDHPLAGAVVRGAKERLGAGAELAAKDVESITGRGVKASVEGKVVYVGNEALFTQIGGPGISEVLRATVAQLKETGRTTMIVRRGDVYLGVIGLMDTPRLAAKGAVDRLRGLGVKRIVMLSGDNQQVADAVAREVGVDEAVGGLMPEEKVEAIKKLRDQGGVAMVGDGVNDAPAMANATVGIAMGAAGSDVALETADVALMADDLNQLPFAVGLSRQTSRVIKQNLWLSLGMVVFLIPATILGLRLGPAVMFHEGSTLVVVFNALRLLAYQERGR
jgi:Zn2+/Cd2+-exporting ATPase